jgi:hypothetical protein
MVAFRLKVRVAVELAEGVNLILIEGLDLNKGAPAQFASSRGTTLSSQPPDPRARIARAFPFTEKGAPADRPAQRLFYSA